MPLPPPADDHLPARIEALIQSPVRRIRHWTPQELEVVTQSIERGRMTKPLMGMLYLALRAEVSGRSWFNEDAFVDRFLYFYSNWLNEIVEKEKEAYTSEDGQKKWRTKHKRDESGKRVRCKEGRYIAVLKEPKTLLSPEAIAKRFVTAVRNKPRDWHRKWGGRTAGADLIDWQRAPDVLAQLEARSEINHLVARTELIRDDTDRQIFALIATGAEPKEVATKLGMNNKTVRSRIHRARVRVRDEAAAK